MIPKKMLTLLMALFVATSFIVGCGDSDSDNTGTDAGAGTDTGTGDDTGTGAEHNSDDVLSFDDLALPPGGIAVEDAPMFVSIGFDDNGYEDAMTWILNYLKDKKNPDGSDARVSFYMATGYVYNDPNVSSPNALPNDSEDLAAVKATWRRAYDEGHEVGNHTQHHFTGYSQWDSSFNPDKVFTVDQWKVEMQAAMDVLTKPEHGIEIPVADITGFRTPFLGYTDATFTAEEQIGFEYDCSIEDGWQSSQNGTNNLWPYNLADGSPGDKTIVSWGAVDSAHERETIGSHPSLWEMPVHPVVIPPDYRAADYGLAPGLRAKCKKAADYFDEGDGKFTGLDYNLIERDMLDLTKDEILATLKYNLDLRMKGNKAPFMFGAHTDYYSERNGNVNSSGTWQERRAFIEEFITYALDKGAFIVPIKGILGWVKDNSEVEVIDGGTDIVDAGDDIADDAGVDAGK